MSHKQYTDKKKYEVVTTWLAVGKVPIVEGITGVPQATIRQWKLQPWWKELVAQIQTESNQELDSKLAKIIERSLDTVNDRIEQGEFMFDPKTGSVKRVPVKLRDVHRVAVDLLDKRDLLRRRPEQEKREEQNADILKKLADQFSDWVKINLRKEPKIIEAEVIIVEKDNALHGEREARLQAGVQKIPQPEEAENQPSPAQQSA